MLIPAENWQEAFAGMREPEVSPGTGFRFLVIALANPKKRFKAR